MHKALEIENLSASYQNTIALLDITPAMESGKIVGIIGPNGAGKSSLIKAVLGLIPIDRGKIEIYGQSLNQMRKRIAYVPQRSNIDWNFPIIVKKQFFWALIPDLVYLNVPHVRIKIGQLNVCGKWEWKNMQKVK